MRTIRTALALTVGTIVCGLAALMPREGHAQYACASYGVSLDATV